MSNVRDFGARGDGSRDETDVIMHAVEQGDGVLRFPSGTYRISRTITIDLSRRGFHAIEGSGGTVRILMEGAGPAFQLMGNHRGTGDPGSVIESVWETERMPTLRHFEIVGAHPEADGVELRFTLQAILEGVLIRNCRNGIRLHERNRNVLINACHVYHNSGAGIFLDAVNLHQINITGNHISYNRRGGIRIEKSEVRNLQITGNDIEYNNHRAHKSEPEAVADILIDASAAGSSVREVTIASNTIQATYSPGGANVRIVGSGPDNARKAGMLTIAGNIIGSQETSVHLKDCQHLALSGNFLYSSQYRNLLIENCADVVFGANSIGHNADYGDKELATGIRIVQSQRCNLSGFSIQDAQASENTVDGAIKLERRALVELIDCNTITISNAQLTDGAPHAVMVENCNGISITGCSIQETRAKPKMVSAIRWTGEGARNLVAINVFQLPAGVPALAAAAASGVVENANVTG
ncbi:MAG: polygalacturonase [Verrucomicrobiales bacterium]|jgi:polygalacturonase